MSLSLSIFQKLCPDCASSVAISVARCDCGYNFESASDNLSPLEATLRDEELYEGYLTARAEQARQVARTADEALFNDMSNPDAVSAAALAREVANSIDGDLAEQQFKIAALRNALQASRPVVPVISQATAMPSNAAEKSASHRPPVTPSTSTRPAPTADAPLSPINIPSTPLVAAPTKTAAAPVASAPVWKTTTTQKAAGVLSAIKNAKVRETIARALQAKAAAEAEQKSKSLSASAYGASPPSAFREEQASRAEKIMEARKTIEGKECPNCTSHVPVNTTRCQCGYAFISVSTELPSLTLCTGDFTALRNSFKLNLR